MSAIDSLLGPRPGRPPRAALDGATLDHTLVKHAERHRVWRSMLQPTALATEDVR